MKKILALLLLFPLLVFGQGTGLELKLFTTYNFNPAFLSSTAFSDVDGDGDQDLLITGYDTLLSPFSKLYINDGNGDFTEVLGTPFEAVSYSSIAFSDVDGDNDQDVLITGYNQYWDPISKLYLNDGSGNFTILVGTPFPPIYDGSIAFSDVDGDGDQDLMITGDTLAGVGEPISKLYLNDGVGNFTEVIGTPFEDVLASSIAFSDVDGDGDQDLLITGSGYGSPTSSGSTAKLYTNDGNGIFTEVLGTPFVGIESGSIAFSDVDGDGDQDLMITGGFSNILPSILYTNDGNGNFTEVLGTPFDGVRYSAVAFSDVDGDGDQDVLITGHVGTYFPISKLYTNDGFGNFTEVLGTPFEGAFDGTISFSDVDADGDKDVLITGRIRLSIALGGSISRLYINDGNGNFTGTTGINEEMFKEFTISPNPAKNEIFIESSQNGLVEIYNIEGRKVVSLEKTDIIQKINIYHLSSGVYFVEGNNTMRKFIKE